MISLYVNLVLLMFKVYNQSMKIELLVSALNKEPAELLSKMNIDADALLINQCDREGSFSFNKDEHVYRIIESKERGVGKSRNLAIENAKGDIVLFSDDDIVYSDKLSEIIAHEFTEHPEADGIFFNVKVCEERKTYENTEFGKVNYRCVGRYPAYSFAIRLEKLLESGITFSEHFGGGAEYSCGEDSLFFMDLCKNHVNLYKSDTFIGEEIPRPSTWFKGYNEKYFFDRGVLYHVLYGAMALPLGIRYIFKNRNKMCDTVKPLKALMLLKKGIKEGKDKNLR
jgi:glycosyltransferase involved in cell wall biosynthesis